jgi:hypothetical protein
VLWKLPVGNAITAEEKTPFAPSNPSASACSGGESIAFAK